MWGGKAPHEAEAVCFRQDSMWGEAEAKYIRSLPSPFIPDVANPQKR